MSDCWDNITVGMKIEVENKDCDKFSNLFPNFYWIATVIKIAGYMAQLRYEGFGTDSSKDFWVNLCTETIHSVGWCASQGKPLIPPKSIEHKYSDWKEYLVKRLTGARTLPVNFHLKNYVTTLPLNLCLRPTSSSGKEYGVWSVRTIAEGTRFGPCEGLHVDRVEHKKKDFQWQGLMMPMVCGHMKLFVMGETYPDLFDEELNENVDGSSSV